MTINKNFDLDTKYPNIQLAKLNDQALNTIEELVKEKYIKKVQNKDFSLYNYTEKEEQIKKNGSGIYNNIWYAVILFFFFSLTAIVMIKVSL